MSTVRLLTSAVIASALLVSCSEAHFYGNTPSRARVTPTTTSALSCAVSPATVKVGAPAAVSVTDSAADAELSQSVGFGETLSDTTLILQNGVYVAKGGAPNQILADAAGHYTIELRVAGTNAVAATCAFDATLDGNPGTTGGTVNGTTGSTVGGTTGGTTSGDPTGNGTDGGTGGTTSDGTTTISGTTGGTTAGTTGGTTAGTTGGTTAGTTGGTTAGTTAGTGGTTGSTTGGTTGSTGGTTGDSTPPAPVCKDTEHATGAHIAFLIDNSNSNSATDCPNAKQIGDVGGSATYQCQSETNREKAVMAAYDLLKGVAAKEPGSTAALSTLAIASFPTHEDYLNGSKNETQGMLEVNAANRSAVGNALAFSRTPYGQTPYLAALTAATDIFMGMADDGKKRVAILVTDGEPTDRSPSAVEQKAAALRAQGIEVITVFYSVPTGQARYDEHFSTMKRFDDATVAAGQGHWYQDAFADLASYVRALVGSSSSPGQKGLAEVISDNKPVEVQNSAELKALFQSIVTKKVHCE